MKFLVNDILLFRDDCEGVKERILWISPDYKVCITIELHVTKLNIRNRFIEEMHVVYDVGAVELIDDELSLQMILSEDLDDGVRAHRDKSFEVINYILEQQNEPYIFDRHKRRKVVLDASRKFNITDVVIYKYLRLFWQGGKIKNALMPNYYRCGAAGKERNYTRKPGRTSNEALVFGKKEGVIIDKEIKTIFQTCIDRYYKNPKERTLTQVYDLMKKDFFSKILNGEVKVFDKIKIPTFRQFQHWHDNYKDFESEIRGRKGEKKFYLDYRALPSNSTYETFGPGNRYQIDATVADVYLVSRIDRTSIIGRPVVYFVVDVFSRLVAGMHVALEGPSWNGASSAIYNCTEDKVEFCKRFGIDIKKEEWPSEGLPQIILADRGELIGPIGEPIIQELGIVIENTPSYRGDAKGIVERNFRTINHKIIHWSPGAIKQEYRERGERDYRLDAILDIHDFTRVIIHAVIEKNKQPLKEYPLIQEMINDNLDLIPTKIWEWGMNNRTGKLRKVSDDILRINLMRRGKGSITEKGVQFNRVLYNAKSEDEKSLYMKARNWGRTSGYIAFDNRDISTIYFIYKNENRVITCTIKQENMIFMGKTFEEVEDFNFNSVVKFEGLTNEKNQNNVEMNTQIEKIIKEAERKSKDAVGKKQTKGIRENRTNENEEYRKEQALIIGKRAEEETRHTNSVLEENECDFNSRALELIKKEKTRRLVRE
ncbi:hypothetical protein [Clostridium saccharoperbutylacetonicum]|uniref:hypothetical protein n=1 Tax=Clostridium saccharoperbutylacetonicum TaxID=36745 RepID=UPI0039E9B19F